MDELATMKKQLPDTVGQLVDYVVINEEKLNAVNAAIRAAKKAGDINLDKLQKQQRELEITTVAAQCRLGELTAEIETKARNQYTDALPEARTKQEQLADSGLTRQRASEYERMAAHPDIVDRVIESGEHVTKSAILNAIRSEEKAKEVLEAQKKVVEERTGKDAPRLIIGDGIGYKPQEKYDLLLTDPPYSTDVDDIEVFAESWLPNALEYVKNTGFAYVFIGAYPAELKAYLNIDPPDNVKLEQLLIWEYKNTLGNNPKDKYKQNYQACLFYRGVNAPALNCPLTSEQWAVQEINAPDGRQGDRYHAWQKPMEIAERFIRHSTKQGMTVFDPFACTGTFLLAAAKLQRIAYGFEIDQNNADIAVKRGCTLCRNHG